MTETHKVSVQTLKRYAKLCNEKAKAKSELARIEGEMKDLTEPIVAYFQRHGKQRDTLEGRTLFLRRELWPGMKDTTTVERLNAALDEVGLGRLAQRRMNVQSMRAIVNETVGTSQGDPQAIFDEAYPQLAEHVKVSEVYKLGDRKA